MWITGVFWKTEKPKFISKMKVLLDKKIHKMCILFKEDETSLERICCVLHSGYLIAWVPLICIMQEAIKSETRNFRDNR